MTHPGVGPIMALLFWLVFEPAERFCGSKLVSSHLGLVPSEESSAERQQLGHISKQGNTLLPFFLVEAAQATVPCDPEWQRWFLHLAMRRERPNANVVMTHKLAVRLYCMSRQRSRLGDAN